MTDKKRWLWKRKSSEKSPGEAESSGSVSSERYSDEQEVSKESSNGSNHSPDVTSKAVTCADDVDDCSDINEQLPDEVASTPLPSSTCIVNGGSLEMNENGENENILNEKEDDLSDGSRDISEKLSAALVNVNAKEDLVKQHAKVAEEAIAGWEKSENEVAVLKKKLETVTLRNSALEDRVTHLDGALKECVRQLRQTREEHEANIQDAVAEKTHELKSDKIKLESKLIELQNKLEASNARSSIDRDMRQRVEWFEKENMALRHEILVQSEELKIRTIERDLSTQAAETASKQHLESIKKVAKLEAECRRLNSMASKALLVTDHKSIASSSFCVESLMDSQSGSVERLTAVDCDNYKMSGLELNRCEPSVSDSWASALIAELDQFKNEKCSRQAPSDSVKIDLMDDFLEMERLVALPETKNESFVEEPVVVDNQRVDKESALRAEFDIMNQQMDELKGKLEKLEADKAELETALMKSEEFIEESQLQLRESKQKLEELQIELENAYKSNQKIENLLMSMEADTRTLSSKVELLEAEVVKERAVSNEVAAKCKNLEEVLEIKSAKVELLEAEVEKEKAMSEEFAMKCSELEEEILRPTSSLYGEKKIKQEDLALAAGKLAECQKTIASLGNQLKSLATLEDFLIDTAGIPSSPSLIAHASGEMWKMHSNDTFSPKRDSISSRMADASSGLSLNKHDESSPLSSSPSASSVAFPNHASSERSRNGFAKFFSRTKSGIRLEI
ncbi:unnamed protein product [Lathyrus oleraceus]